MKSIEKIQKLIRQELGEAMYIDGGINEPSAPEGVPHRMPAAQAPKDDERKDVDDKYDLAFKAREATENLVKHLDTSIYDDAYESAYKATMALRDVLNTLIELGASAENEKAVVAPPEIDQKYDGGRGDFTLNPLTTGGFSANMVQEGPQIDGNSSIEDRLADAERRRADAEAFLAANEPTNIAAGPPERLHTMIRAAKHAIADHGHAAAERKRVEREGPDNEDDDSIEESKRYLKKLIQAELAKLA